MLGAGRASPFKKTGNLRRVRLRTEGRGQPEGLPQSRSPKPALRRIWADQGICPERRVASFLVTFSRKSNTCYSAVHAEENIQTCRNDQLATSSVPSGQLLLKENPTSCARFLNNLSISKITIHSPPPKKDRRMQAAASNVPDSIPRPHIPAVQPRLYLPDIRVNPRNIRR